MTEQLTLSQFIKGNIMTLHIYKMNMCKKYYLIHYSVRDIIKYQFKEHFRNLESTGYLSIMSMEMSSRPYVSLNM